MDARQKKRAVIFYGIVGAVVLISIFYFIKMVSANSHKKQSTVVMDNFQTFDEKKEVYKKKSVAYDDLNKEKQRKVREENVNIDLSTFDNDVEKNKKKAVEEFQQQAAEQPQPQTQQREQPVNQNPRPRTRTIQSNNTNQVRNASRETQSEQKEVAKEQPTSHKETYGFTEFNANNTINSNEDHPKNTVRYMEAFLEDDSKISDVSDLTFILSNDYVINGVKFQALSILYGRSSAKNTYFDVNVYQILNSADGIKYPANLTLYNSNYGRGIKYEGNINRAVKDESNEAIQNSSLPVSTNTGELATYAISTTANVVKGTMNKLKKDYSIPLNKNLKVYFVQEKN